jgi:hypothetical protein
MVYLVEELEHGEMTKLLRGYGWPLWFAHQPLYLTTSTPWTLRPNTGHSHNLHDFNGHSPNPIGVYDVMFRTCAEQIQYAASREHAMTALYSISSIYFTTGITTPLLSQTSVTRYYPYPAYRYSLPPDDYRPNSIQSTKCAHWLCSKYDLVSHKQ